MACLTPTNRASKLVDTSDRRGLGLRVDGRVASRPCGWLDDRWPRGRCCRWGDTMACLISKNGSVRLVDIGEHSREVLAEFGLEEERIQALIDAGVVGTQ